MALVFAWITRFAPPWAALKTSVGKDRLKCFLQASTMCLGTRSILFMSRIRRLPWPVTCFSSSTERQDSGSLASSTSMMMSAEAKTFLSSTLNFLRVFSASRSRLPPSNPKPSSSKAASAATSAASKSEVLFWAWLMMSINELGFLILFFSILLSNWTSVMPSLSESMSSSSSSRPLSLALISFTFVAPRCFRKFFDASFVIDGLCSFLFNAPLLPPGLPFATGALFFPMAAATGRGGGQGRI
mmetsp:Transcript_43312/g.92721  ORF Transcript_43312/g.92721 Transcript_43312/m.92721 type:complete len:243 (-) Transcript_43312:107-835(-)